MNEAYTNETFSKMLEDHFKKTLTVVDWFLYGSVCYGTQTDKSDIDVLVVLSDDFECFSGTNFSSSVFDVHLISKTNFENGLNNMNIKYLECYFSSICGGILKYHITFDLAKLRESVSKTTSNSFVKAKKKIELDYEDTYIGFKSIFHAIRLIDFGIQLATLQHIKDFKSMNHVWYDILKMYQESSSWDEVNHKYKPLFNLMMTEFRKVCPK